MTGGRTPGEIKKWNSHSHEQYTGSSCDVKIGNISSSGGEVLVVVPY